MPPLVGCIADDFTGATDLANMLVRGGLRTVQLLDVPSSGVAAGDVDAIVVALKSRSVPSGEAVAMSLEALGALRRAGVERFLFKYCSTFDSTASGNIGPVAEALLHGLKLDQTIFCPAFPENGRTVYLGHLFVRGALLSESGMEYHPLNPMTDSNLVRVLGAQATHPVGLVPYPIVERGREAVSEELERLRRQGRALVVVDAVSDLHLETLAEAVSEMALVTGGSAIGLSLARVYRSRGLLGDVAHASRLPAVAGSAAVVAGSCSEATRRQVAAFELERPSYRIEPERVVAGEPVVEEALEWAGSHLPEGPVLVYSTATPEELEFVHRRVGREVAAASVEQALGSVTRGLVARGVRRLVLAGGETSGAILEALGVTQLRIGPQIDPGVPWTESVGPQPLALALKSGNFGSDDFFLKALEMLP